MTECIVGLCCRASARLVLAVYRVGVFERCVALNLERASRNSRKGGALPPSRTEIAARLYYCRHKRGGKHAPLTSLRLGGRRVMALYCMYGSLVP